MATGAGSPAKRSSGARRGRGRPTSHSAQDTRDAILATALRKFGASAYDGVSMEALAAESEVNTRAIYYHFDSKRALFDAATEVALARFGDQVVAQVFCHDTLRERVGGYIDVYRTLHLDDPHVVPFIGRMLADSLAVGTGSDSGPPPAGAVLRQLLESLVDDGIEAGEVNAELDRDGALQLLIAIGMGLSLVAIDDDAFEPMLDALEMLTAGTLFADPSV